VRDALGTPRVRVPARETVVVVLWQVLFDVRDVFWMKLMLMTVRK
jgi:hypothetical protein